MPVKNSRGFTLIEIILAIVLASILGVFSIQYLYQVASVNQLMAGQKNLVDEARLGMEFMIREIRMADPATPIVFTPTSITFDKLNGYPQDTNTTGITYTFNAGAGTLERTTSGPTTTTLASRVTSFTVTQPAANFYVFIMTLQGAEGENYSLESSVRPRGFI